MGVCILPFLLLAGSARAASGWISPDFPGGQVFTGTVSYKEGAEIPSTAMAHVELIDLSISDQRKSILGEDKIWTAGIKPPVTFRIVFDPTRIDPTHTYIVRARITDGDKTLYTGISKSHVITKGAPRIIDIQVSPVSIFYR